MRSSLFQLPSNDIILHNMLSQCRLRSLSSTLCTTSLKILLMRLKDSPNIIVKNEARQLLNVLIHSEIYKLRQDRLLLLRFSIPTTNNPLIDEIENSLKKIDRNLYSRPNSPSETFEVGIPSISSGL